MRTRTTLTAAALGIPFVLATASAAVADTVTVPLEPVGAGESAGTAELEVDEEAGTLDVSVRGEGVAPEVPVAHYLAIGGEGVCPPDDADVDDDGVLTAAEVEPFVGEPVVALTAEGDYDPRAVLDVDTLPVATADGEVVLVREYDLEVIDPFDLERAVLIGYAVMDPELPPGDAVPLYCGVVDLAAASGGDAAPTTGAGEDAAPTTGGEDAAPTTGAGEDAAPTTGGEDAAPTTGAGEDAAPTTGAGEDAAPTTGGEDAAPTTGGEDAAPTTGNGAAAGDQQVEQMPAGGVPAGGGGTAGVENGALFVLGGAGLAGAGALALRRRARLTD